MEGEVEREVERGREERRVGGRERIEILVNIYAG